MNNVFTRRLAVLSLGLFGLAGMGLSADKEGFAGEWKLDVAHSKSDPAPGLKSFDAKVTTRDGSFTFKSEWVEGDGTPNHMEFTAAPDGKSMPATGYPAVDSVQFTRVNEKTYKFVFLKNGKVVETETQTLSADGKTIRDVDTGKDENGKPFTDRLLLRRQ